MPPPCVNLSLIISYISVPYWDVAFNLKNTFLNIKIVVGLLGFRLEKGQVDRGYCISPMAQIMAHNLFCLLRGYLRHFLKSSLSVIVTKTMPGDGGVSFLLSFFHDPTLHIPFANVFPSFELLLHKFKIYFDSLADTVSAGEQKQI